MNIKNTAKAMLPKTAWNFLQHHKSILRDIIDNRGAEVCRIEYRGRTLLYGRGDSLIKKIRNGRIFEEKMCRAIVDDLAKKQGSGFLDIGANIGLISLYVLSERPNTKIYAFEPGPYQSEYFEKTIAENKLETQIELTRNALGDRNEKVTFMTHFAQSSSGDGLIDTKRAGAAIPVTVDMTTLDLWWSSAKKPNIGVVKIDTEGAELWILRGAEKFLEEMKPVIFLEIETKNLQVYPYTRNDILKWFIEHSYNLYTLDNELCTLENFSSFIGKYDTYIARPKA